MENLLVALSNELAAAVAQAGQSVVTVHGRPRIASSGVHWQPGVIVTADHTLRREEDIRVTLPGGETVPAEIAGRDPGTDLAVLRTNADATPAVQIEPNLALQAGNLILAVGRSQDTGPVAAMGVISSVSGPWRTWRGGKVDQFLRLDVGLYPGSSGGAVVNASGQFLALATDGLSRTSTLGIPVQTIQRVVNQLLEKGHIPRGYLGIGLQPVALPEHRKGLIVLSVEPEAPAGKAGLVIGDVLTAIDGKPVADTDDVQAVLGSEYLGKTVAVSLIRGGVAAEVQIAIGERPRGRA